METKDVTLITLILPTVAWIISLIIWTSNEVYNTQGFLHRFTIPITLTITSALFILTHLTLGHKINEDLTPILYYITCFIALGVVR